MAVFTGRSGPFFHRSSHQPPPRDSRFGSPFPLSHSNWVRPEVVQEVTYLTWTENNLLRQVSYQGQRQDEPARQVVRPVPRPLRKAKV
jgi:bifunctional non-homologous end joining protein LigD